MCVDSPSAKKAKNPDKALEEGALALIERFHALHGRPTDGRKPPRRELEFARGLVADFGFERAAYVVTYGFRAAKETHYTARFLQGFEQYVGEAIEDFAKHQEREARKRRAQAEREAEERAAFEEAREFYSQPLDERVERVLTTWVRTMETLKKRRPTDQEIADKRTWYTELQEREEAEFREELERRSA